MNAQPDSLYFKLRAEQEALAAVQSKCTRAREAHGLIAARYLELSRELEFYDSEPAGVPLAETAEDILQAHPHGVFPDPAAIGRRLSIR